MERLPFTKLSLQTLILAALTAMFCFSVARASVNTNLAKGWNLVGNTSTTTIDVAQVFGAPEVKENIVSVWSWNASTNRWAFYSPTLAAQGATTLPAYAAQKGYDVLTALAPGEGYWINLGAATTLPTLGGATRPFPPASLVTGWNLIADGSGASPPTFELRAVAAGKPIITLWAWDNVASLWYFYSPSLAAQSDAMLNDYIRSHGYLGFATNDKRLDPGVGFWVNARSASNSGDIRSPGFVVATKLYVSSGATSAEECASDTNDGLVADCSQFNPNTRRGPLRTIQKAIDSAPENSEIAIRAGFYLETPVIDRKKYLLLRPYGDKDTIETVVVSAAIPEMVANPGALWVNEGVRTGIYSGKNFRLWSYAPVGGFEPTTPDNPNPTRFTKNTLSADDDRLFWTYSGSTLMNLRHMNGKNGGDGVYFTADKAFLGLSDLDANPNLSRFYLSRTRPTLSIRNSQNIVVDGVNRSLIFKHGSPSSIVASDNIDLAIRNVKTINSIDGIALYSKSVGGNRNLRIEGNLLALRFDPGWSWVGVKHCNTAFKTAPRWEENADMSGCHYGKDGVEGGELSNAAATGIRSMEGKGILIATEHGNEGVEIFGNEIDGHFDGIGFGVSGNIAAEFVKLAIHDNAIHNAFDDGIEMDHPATLTVNGDIYSNNIFDVFAGLSFQPHASGMLYLHENIVVANKDVVWGDNFNAGTAQRVFGPATKFQGNKGQVSRGARIYFNTFHSQEGILVGYSPADYRVFDLEFVDNIFHSTGRSVISSGLATEGIDYDSNLFYSSRSSTTRPYKNWNSFDNAAFSSLAAVPMPAGWENNIEADPQFEATGIANPRQHFRLRASSPARTNNGMLKKLLPQDWPNATMLNSRTSVGALE